jgi:hypothetical protein
MTLPVPDPIPPLTPNPVPPLKPVPPPTPKPGPDPDAPPTPRRAGNGGRIDGAKRPR